MRYIISLNSAKPIYLNRDEVINELKRIAIKIKEDERENLVDIILFGSIAKGTNTGTSDVDILIILKECNLNLFERIRKFLKYFDIEVGIDLLVYTENEFEKMKEKNPLILEIILSGFSILN